MDLKGKINRLRDQVGRVERSVVRLHADADKYNDCPQPQPCDRGEMHANITLAYRHLEDARMRLGKVIQAAEGGISVYDKRAPKR